MQIKNKHSIVIIILLFIFLMIEGIYLYVLPNFFDLNKRIPLIEKIYNEKTGSKIDIKNVKLTTYADFSIGLRSENFTAVTPDNRKVIEANDVFVRINILPLLLKNISVKNLSAKSLYADIERFKNGTFNVEKLAPQSKEKIFNLKVKNTKFNISKYNIKFKDQKFNKKFQINGNYFKISKLTLDKLIDLETQGNIISSDSDTEFQIRFYTKFPIVKNISNSNFVVSGFIRNLEPKTFNPYLKEYFDKTIQETNGNISFDFYTKKLNKKQKEILFEGAIDNLLIKKSLLENTISAPGKNIVITRLVVDDRTINIKEFFIKGKDYRIEADGLIKDYKTKKPYLDLNTRIPKSKTESIVSILPPNLIPKRDEIKKVKRYGLYGDIDADVKIKGKIPRPDITGQVNSTNVHVLRGLEKKHTGKIKLTFEEKILNTDVQIKLLPDQYAVVKGKTYIYKDKENHFAITSSKSLDLPLTQKILLPIQDVFQFQLGPVPQMKITNGTGQVDLDIVGTKISGVVKGSVIFNSADASYNGIEAKLKKGNGRVDFYGKKILFKTTQAFIENYPVTIFGTAVINKDVDFNINTDSVNSAILLSVVNKSELLSEIKEKLETITDVSGICSFKLNIKAKISDYSTMIKNPKEALKDMNVTGNLTFKNARGNLKGFRVPLNNIKGSVDFTQASVKLNNLTAKVEHSPIKVYGNISNNLITSVPTVNIFAESKKILLKDSIKFLVESDLSKNIKELNLPLDKVKGQHDLFLNYTSASKDFDINSIIIKSNFQNISAEKPPYVNSGKLTLDNGILKIENLNAKVYNTAAKISGTISNLDKEIPSFNLILNANNLDLKALNHLNRYGFVQTSIKNILNQYTNYSGNADLYLKLNDLNITGNINLTDVGLTHKLTNTPIKINHTKLKLESNKIIAEAIDANIGNAPFHSDFVISNFLTKKPNISGYVTTKITDEFIENYVNTKLTYPIKVKGDIDLTADFAGDLNNLEIDNKIKFNEGSDLSYLSANLGDQNDIREININTSVSPGFINVKNFEYVKYITSQNNKPYPVVFATLKGNLQKINGKYELNSLLIKTNNNLPTRFLNFAFKKSVLKQGTFNCALFYKTNTKTKVPKIFGNIDFKNIDIPLYDTVIKDISIDSERNIINLNVRGISFDSDFTIDSKIANNLVLPIDIKEINIVSEKLNFDKLLDNLTKMSIETYQNKSNQQLPQNFNLSSFLIQKGHFTANDINFRSLPAKNLKADFSFDRNSLLKMNNVSFDVAGGTLSGEGEYNSTNRTVETTLSSKDVDANSLSDALFNMKGQVYGKMDGQLYIRTKGSTQEERLKNLSGFVYFNIKNGRMPKLGSLEYLLRASNVVKSGITGLTINSIIDVMNPIKTGHFASINGSFSLDDGVAKNIEIYSKGENLSIYVKGKYDLVNSDADMRVLGKLSNKITTLLGPIGNTSINSIFSLIPKLTLAESDRDKFMKDISKIPGLDFTNADYRIFQAKIDGNINGNAYVSSFKWVE